MAEGLLSGKRGVVFGVANEKSIAWGCAQACAAQGASLAFNYLGESLERRVRKLVDENMPGSPVLNCNVQNDEEIAHFFSELRKEWDSIDFLIHSVAFADKENLKDKYITTPRAGFTLALDISAYSLVALAREAAPMMNKGGSIVAMTYYGAEKVVPRYNVMGVAKAALESAVRYLAADLGGRGIRVNTLSPGPVNTVAARGVKGLLDMIGYVQERSPLKRPFGQQEIAGSALYLLSDLSRGVTGQIIYIDSGYNTVGM